MSTCRQYTVCTRTVACAEASWPTTTSRPPGRVAARKGCHSAPVGSSDRSARPPVAAASWSAKSSLSRSTTSSAPRAFASVAFSDEEVTATTRAPRAVASWTA